MPGDVVHGLEHIFALVSLFQSRQEGLFRLLGLLHPFLKIQHRLLQFPVMKGLEQEIHRAQPQGLLGIGEAVIGGENNYIHRIPLLPQGGKHLQSVHFRHFQVGNNQGRMIALHRFQGFPAVGSLSHHHAVQGCPVHRQGNALADQFLIFHHQHFQHTGSSLQSSTAVTTVPGPSGLRSRYRPNSSP